MAHLVLPAQRENAVTVVKSDLSVFKDPVERKVRMVQVESPDLLVLPDQRVMLVQLAPVVLPEALDRVDQTETKATLVFLVLLDLWETRAPRELSEILDLQVRPVSVAQLVLREILALSDLLAAWVSRDLRATKVTLELLVVLVQWALLVLRVTLDQSETTAFLVPLVLKESAE